MALTGIGWGFLVGQAQLLLAALPRDLQGRGLAISGSGSMLTQSLGFALGGAAAEVLPPHVVVALGGVAGLVVTGTLLWRLRAADGVSGPGGPGARGRAA
jgi:hypothetical protein